MRRAGSMLTRSNVVKRGDRVRRSNSGEAVIIKACFACAPRDAAVLAQAPGSLAEGLLPRCDVNTGCLDEKQHEYN